MVGRFVVGLMILCLPVAAALAQPPVETPPERPAEAKQEQPAGLTQAQTHKWEFGISIRSVGGPSAGLLGTFPVPTEWPEQQVKVVHELISPTVQRHSYRTSDGLKQMVFNVPQLGAGSTAECFFTFEITKRSQVPPEDPSKLVIPKSVPRELQKFVTPSPLIESTNAKVRTLCRELTADKETAWDQVKGILDGVREQVKYEQDNKNVMKGVIGALRDGKADREDLTATFVAVCRAAKIPARMVWVMDFCYAEFYLEEMPDAPDGDEEQAAGAKKSTKEKSGKGAWYPCVVHQNVDLGVCRDFRPIMAKGDNFKVPEEKAPQRYVKEFLTGKGGTGGKPTVEFRRRNAD